MNGYQGLRRYFGGYSALDRFFDQLTTDFRNLALANTPTPEAQQALDTIIQEAAANQGPTWDLVHRLEGLLIAHVPKGQLALLVPVLRLRYKALCPSDVFEAYEQSAAAPAIQTDLKTQAFFLLTSLQRLRVLNTEFSHARRKIIIALPIIIVSILGTFLVVDVFWKDAPLSLYVFMAGMIGAFFSAVTRVESIVFNASFMLNYQQTGKFYRSYLANLFLSMTEGALGALIFYMMQVAGLVEGSLFPEFEHLSTQANAGIGGAVSHAINVAMPVAIQTPPPGATLFDVFRNAHPSDVAGYGKLFIWSFIAGFSERFVPDFLERFTNKGGKTTNDPLTDESPPDRQAGGRPKPLVPSEGGKGGLVTEMQMVKDASAQVDEGVADRPRGSFGVSMPMDLKDLGNKKRS